MMPQDSVRKGSAVIVDNETDWVLQKRDNKDGILSPGKIGLWGGKQEPADSGSSESTARRELAEELGLTEDEYTLKPFGTISGSMHDTKILQHEFETKLFIAKLNKPVTLHANEGQGIFRLNKNFGIEDINPSNFSRNMVDILGRLMEYENHND